MLEKAGIREIATTKDVSGWASTRVHAVPIDLSTLVKLDSPGVDYQLNRASATTTPWVNSNLWKILKDHGKAFLYEVTGTAVPLAMAEAQTSGATTYFRIQQTDLEMFQRCAAFARELNVAALPSRVNVGLVDDGSPMIGEAMNLLVRRNLLFDLVHNQSEFKGPVVRLGTPEYPTDVASDPYKFAALVRSRIGDDQRLIRLYGSETTLARLYGDQEHARLHLIQYGRNPVTGLRVRVRGRYPRVVIAELGAKLVMPEDLAVDKDATEFTIPELKTYAVIDLDARGPGVLTSVRSDRDFDLTADPKSPEWRSIPPAKVPLDVAGQTLPMAATEVRSRWTRDSLYLLYACPYRSLSLKPSPATDRETPQLWNWDVAEVFIGADMKNIGQYREYQVSPQGEWVDLDIDVVNPKPGGGMSWNSGFTVKARIDETHKIWYGEMRIPLSSIAARSFNAGDQMRVGLFRITGVPPERNLVAWQPSYRRNFHVPEAFGTLVLGQ
jgi:hypothetical protein